MTLRWDLGSGTVIEPPVSAGGMQQYHYSWGASTKIVPNSSTLFVPSWKAHQLAGCHSGVHSVERNGRHRRHLTATAHKPAPHMLRIPCAASLVETAT